MNDNRAVVADADHELEALAAELTGAAYGVALRHGAEDKWLDLELELWQALKVAAQKWGGEKAPLLRRSFFCHCDQATAKGDGGVLMRPRAADEPRTRLLSGGR